VNAKDATTQLWLFSELVKNKPAKGTNDYPVAIKAVHLDENWKRTTLRPPKDSDTKTSLYEVAYDEDGTRITRIFADGKDGDLLHWDGARWWPLTSVVSEDLYVLGLQNSQLRWIKTQDCAE
jgi:hypothetical protein